MLSKRLISLLISHFCVTITLLKQTQNLDDVTRMCWELTVCPLKNNTLPGAAWGLHCSWHGSHRCCGQHTLACQGQASALPLHRLRPQSLSGTFRLLKCRQLRIVQTIHTVATRTNAQPDLSCDAPVCQHNICLDTAGCREVIENIAAAQEPPIEPR